MTARVCEVPNCGRPAAGAAWICELHLQDRIAWERETEAGGGRVEERRPLVTPQRGFVPPLWADALLPRLRTQLLYANLFGDSESRRWARLRREDPKAYRRAVRWSSLRAWCRRHHLPVPWFADVTLPPDPNPGPVFRAGDTITIPKVSP